jgi:hypothetical protein
LREQIQRALPASTCETTPGALSLAGDKPSAFNIWRYAMTPV